MNPCVADLVNVGRDELRGRDPLDVIAPADHDEVRGPLRGRAGDGAERAVRRVTLLGRDRDPLDVTLRFARIDYDGEPATLVVFVPPAKPVRSHTVSVLERATADLVRAASTAEVCAVAVETAAETLDPELVGVYTPDDAGSLTPEMIDETAADLSTTTITPATEAVWAAFRAGESRVVPAAEHDLWAALDLLVVPLGDHGLLVAAAEPDGTLEGSVEVVGLLATNAQAALDRVQREERLERLHETTRSLMNAETETEVADVAITTARDVLSHDICGVHLYDPDRDALVPAAASDRTREFLGDRGDLPAFERGESLTFEAFETGETRVYDRVNEARGVMDPTTRVRSELIVPLGDRGVFLAGSSLPAQFDETDVSLAKVLCANVEAALERAEREETLRRQEAELRERNSRLDEFASVVSHDLRNPLNVAQGRLELARDAPSRDAAAEHLDAVTESHDRMEELVADLLTLARQGRGAGDTEAVDVGALARTCWAGLGPGELVVDDEPTVEADRSRLRELLENLLQNSVEHGSTSPHSPAREDSVEHGSTSNRTAVQSGDTVEHGSSEGQRTVDADGTGPTVRIGALRAGGSDDVDRRGFFVEDDGPGIPEDERETVFEHGYSTDADGTGFGLAIVSAVADAHGWDVRLTEGREGGARFEFLL
nr:ATP-binding protein [Salinigranum marinum]